jgi:hypothetical protein
MWAMAVSHPQPRRHSHERSLYGWLEVPSAASGAASVFDFLGLRRWFRANHRFQPGVDRRMLASDYDMVVRDLRRAYYVTLREEGVEPREERVRRAEEQITLFDRSVFLHDKG